MIDTTREKRCRKCGVTKSSEYFHRHVRSSDGLTPWCKPCRSENRSKKDYGVSVSEKRCTKCDLIKPSDEFSPNRQNKSGLFSWCKACHRGYGSALDYSVDASVTEKCCVECKSVKPVDQFNRNCRNSDGLQSRCKVCQKGRHRDWYLRNSESVIERTKLWAANNPEKAKVLSRNRQRRRLYGLSPSEYDRMFEDQGGKCASCGDDFDGTPHVDHDHVTGAVRELLCGPCNKALGMALESPERLLGLVRYLRRHGKE